MRRAAAMEATSTVRSKTQQRQKSLAAKPHKQTPMSTAAMMERRGSTTMGVLEKKKKKIHRQWEQLIKETRQKQMAANTQNLSRCGRLSQRETTIGKPPMKTIGITKEKSGGQSI